MPEDYDTGDGVTTTVTSGDEITVDDLDLEEEGSEDDLVDVDIVESY